MARRRDIREKKVTNGKNLKGLMTRGQTACWQSLQLFQQNSAVTCVISKTSSQKRSCKISQTLEVNNLRIHNHAYVPIPYTRHNNNELYKRQIKKHSE